MATTTTLPTVKDAIITLLNGDSTFDDVQVSYGYPGDNATQEESIWLGFAEADVDITALRAGRKRRDETYTLQVIVEVIKVGGTQEEADERCAALAGAVESAIADDLQLDLGSTIFWAYVTGWNQVGGAIDRGHACRMELELTIQARLN